METLKEVRATLEAYAQKMAMLRMEPSTHASWANVNAQLTKGFEDPEVMAVAAFYAEYTYGDTDSDGGRSTSMHLKSVTATREEWAAEQG